MQTSGRQRDKRQRGFTLLEVLIAFLVFAMAFGAVLQVFSGSLRNASLAGDYSIAVGHAESLLARAGVETALAAGERSGNLENGMRWHLETRPDGPQSNSLATYRLEVTVSWERDGKSRSVHLTTLRLQELSP